MIKAQSRAGTIRHVQVFLLVVASQAPWRNLWPGAAIRQPVTCDSIPEIRQLCYEPMSCLIFIEIDLIVFFVPHCIYGFRTTCAALLRRHPSCRHIQETLF